MSDPRTKYSNIESDSNIAEEEIEVPIASSNYPSILEDRTSKRFGIVLKICVGLIGIFLLLTVSLCFVFASKGHPGFYWLGVALIVLSVISAVKLHWMKEMDWDNKVKYATVAQSGAVIFLCMGLMAVMYGPRLKEVGCSANYSGFFVTGTISGLIDDNLVLANNGATLHVASKATSFAFGTRYIEGSTYMVSVAQQPYQSDPNKPTQYCLVQSPTGTIGHGNVTNVIIYCRST